MTLERGFEELEPRSVDQEIEFARARMSTFWNNAREEATVADAIVTAFLGNKSFYRGSEALAMAAAQDDSAYKVAVGRQAMYDRWTMREAAVLAALTSYKTWIQYEQKSANGIGLDVLGLKRTRLGAYRDNILFILKKAKGKS